MTLSRITVKETQCVDFSVRTDTNLPAEKLATSSSFQDTLTLGSVHVQVQREVKCWFSVIV
jgi:hypothetical protein